MLSATMIPSVLNSLINARVWKSELLETLMDIVENDRTLVAACSQALFSSIHRQHESIAIRLIKAGVPLSIQSPEFLSNSSSVLIAAICQGSDAVTDELLKAGADVNALGYSGNVRLGYMTPLDAAASMVCVKALRSEINHTSKYSLFYNGGDLVQELLKRGASPFDKAAFNRSISNIPIFQTLLEAALDTVTRSSQAPSGFWHAIFRMAISQRDSALALMIMERRLLDPNLMWDNYRPLYFALKLDFGPNYEFLNILLRFGADVNLPICSQHAPTANYYLAESPLMVAISLKDRRKVEFLLRNGAEINMPYNLDFGHSALQHAIMVQATKEIVILLLESRADPNFFTPYKLSPLQLAIDAIRLDHVKYFLEIISLLLDYGADPNLVTNLWIPYIPSTCLQMAAKLYNTTLVKLLLDHRADPNLMPTEESRTPVQIATSNCDAPLVKLLLDHQADPNLIPTRTSYTPLQIAAVKSNIPLVKLLLDHRADPNLMPMEPSHTPLQIAARDGNKEITELLLECGANVNAPPCPNSGATALQFAAIGGYLGIAFLLLDYNVDVNAAGAPINGRTALEGATEHGRIDMIKMLLNAGVDIHEEGQIQYERALDFASNNGHHAARQMLEEYHASSKY